MGTASAADVNVLAVMIMGPSQSKCKVGLESRDLMPGLFWGGLDGPTLLGGLVEDMVRTRMGGRLSLKAVAQVALLK